MGNLKSYITKFVMIIQIHRYYIDSHLVVKIVIILFVEIYESSVSHIKSFHKHVFW